MVLPNDHYYLEVYGAAELRRLKFSVLALQGLATICIDLTRPEMLYDTLAVASLYIVVCKVCDGSTRSTSSVSYDVKLTICTGIDKVELSRIGCHALQTPDNFM